MCLYVCLCENMYVCVYNIGQYVCFCVYMPVCVSMSVCVMCVCIFSGNLESWCFFLGQVDPAGIAAKDGRIREGDQILQVSTGIV